jgi:NTP pyrophosphatase (non-canonical NTP hydrolase)
VVRELLRRSRQPVDLVSIRIEEAYEQHDFRYKFDKIFSPFLNKANQRYKLADFAHTTVSLSFKLERELLEEFEKLITPEFEVTYA